jgi:hypothetical protein
MLTLLITSVLILGLVIVAVYFWQKPASASDPNELPPPPAPRGLFEEPDKVEQFKGTLDEALTRSEVFAQASAGDKKSLQKARELENEDLYDQALTTLVIGINSDAQLLSLVSCVLKNQWPVNKTLANAYIASWLKAPDKTSTTKTLHIAALSNDAETYRGAAELALKFWREGKLPDTTAIELNALLNGEFWVLSSATRNSGAGFVLKRSLASARRELEGTNTNN